MKRKVIGIICALVLSACSLQPGYCASTQLFAQHYDSAQNYLAQGQHSSAIVEFRKALRINYLDNSARIGIINSYLARATYYANQEKDYEKAANDFRSAIFYLKIYPKKDQTVANSAGMIASANENLNQCLKVTGFDRTPSNRYKKAEELRAASNFSAAAYEFMKSADNGSIAWDANVQIADLLKVMGNIPRSVDYYKKAVELKPNDGSLRLKYARTLDRLGEYDEALIQYNYVLANSKGDNEVLNTLERLYINKLAQTPSDADLNANLGAIKQALGDFEGALKYYGKAEQLDPNNVNTRLNVGTLYQQKKDYVKAMKAYDSVLTLYPDNVQANLYKAQALAEMGDKKTAIWHYKKVLSLDPSNAVAKAEIVNVMQDTMTTKEFIAYLSQNTDDKTMCTMLYDYAYKLHKENKIQDAITAYKAVVSSDSSNVDAYVNLAICYASLNDYKSAKNVLNTAKSKFPSNNLVIKTLKDVQADALSETLASANLDYENKNYEKALSKYLSVSPDTEDSLLGAAACYEGMKNTDKAIEFYKKAILINPKNAEIFYYIGYLYSEQQKWKDSETYLKKALALNPESEAKGLLEYVNRNSVNSELNDGINLLEQKNYESALTKFNEVLKKDSDNAYAYYYRGMAYDEQKKTQMAINDYLNVLKNTKDIPIVNYMLAVDYDGMEKYKEAYKYYNEFIGAYTADDEYLKYAKTRMEELKPYANQ